MAYARKYTLVRILQYEVDDLRSLDPVLKHRGVKGRDSHRNIIETKCVVLDDKGQLVRDVLARESEDHPLEGES